MMRRMLDYLLLFLVVVVLQVFLFDNLDTGLYLHPMIYMAFILLLPVETVPILVLLLGLATGVTVDLLTGAAGLNTLSVLPVAFMRGAALRLTCSKDSISDGGIPSVRRLGKKGFLRYIILAVTVHALIYFIMERASIDYFLLALLRVLISCTVTVLLVYFTAKIFTTQVSNTV